MQAKAGAKSAQDLDKGGPTAISPPRRLFQSIADDGFDPARVSVSKTLSLLNYVSKKKRFRSLRGDYDHDLWHVLAHRQLGPGEHEALLAKTLPKIKFIALTSEDLERAWALGLAWPKCFTYVTEDDFPEFRPMPLPMDSKTLEPLATLDGLLVLLLLFRRSLDASNMGLASQLLPPLEEVCRIFGYQWHGEAGDTWRYVVRTRILAWRPDLEPTPEALQTAQATLLKEFEATSSQGHGRRPLAPNMSARGKVERRWRRRVLMRAGTLSDVHAKDYVGFQARSKFNGWLVDSPQVIDASLARAAHLLYVGEGCLPEVDAEHAAQAPLVVPVDTHHQIIGPPVDPYDEYRLGGSVFEHLRIIRKFVEDEST